MLKSLQEKDQEDTQKTLIKNFPGKHIEVKEGS